MAFISSAHSKSEVNNTIYHRHGRSKNNLYIFTALFLTGSFMVAWTWKTWPDVLIDFGRELYLPWQILRGRILYHNLAHFNGPFSVYLNALAYKIGGIGLNTIIASNLMILIGITALLYHLIKTASNSLAALAGCLFFLTVFACGNLMINIGNYNYLTPYSHEITHGMLLSLLTLHAMNLWRRNDSKIWLGLGGFCLGLAFLTKAEVFLACAVSSSLDLYLTLAMRRSRPAIFIRYFSAFYLFTLAPIILAFILLRQAMPAEETFSGILGTWGQIFNAQVSQNIFYQWCSGFNSPFTNALAMVRGTMVYAVVLLAMICICNQANLFFRQQHLPVYIFILFFASIIIFYPCIPWGDIARPLPLLVLAAIMIMAYNYYRDYRRQLCRFDRIPPITLGVFGLLMLGKIILFSRFYHYGFALAMPGTMVVIAALTCWLPGIMEKKWGTGNLMKAAALAIIGATILVHLNLMKNTVNHKKTPVSTEADRFYADKRGLFVNEALIQMGKLIQPNQTLLVLPEGIMLNYLARRDNPSPYNNFMPIELAMYGEDAMLNKFKDTPPDFVALIHKDTREYGYSFFGKDYGQKLQAWVDANYRPVTLIGAPPLRDNRFGIQILQRK